MYRIRDSFAQDTRTLQFNSIQLIQFKTIQYIICTPYEDGLLHRS